RTHGPDRQSRVTSISGLWATIRSMSVRRQFAAMNGMISRSSGSAVITRAVAGRSRADAGSFTWTVIRGSASRLWIQARVRGDGVPLMNSRPSTSWIAIAIRRASPVRRPGVVMSIGRRPSSPGTGVVAFMPVPSGVVSCKMQLSLHRCVARRRPRAGSDALALGSHLRLLGPLPRLVGRKRLGRVGVAERHVIRRELLPAGWGDTQLLAEDRGDGARLHRPEPGQLEQPGVQVRAILCLGPDPAGVAAVALDDERAQLLRPVGHVGRDTGTRGGRAKPRVQALRVHRGDRRRIQPADPALQLERAGERLLERHLLVELEADQQRERLVDKEAVGVVVAGERELLDVGHGPIIARGRLLGSAAMADFLVIRGADLLDVDAGEVLEGRQLLI